MSLDAIERMILDRCAAAEYPYLSDILGRDWSSGAWVFDPQAYRVRALEVARRIYAAGEG